MPAKDEVRRRRPFAGRTGLEFDIQYLPLAGLERQDVRVTNACLSPLPGFRNPEDWEGQACASHHLYGEILLTCPEIIIPMGSVACSLFDNPISLDHDHGIPQWNSLRKVGCEWEGWIFPTFHPAAGLHEGQFMIPIRGDFAALRKFLRGEQVIPEDEFPSPVLEEVTTFSDLQYTLALRDGDEIAMDTESDKLGLWGMSFSVSPDAGYVIAADRDDLLAELSCYLREMRPSVSLHYALHDMPVLRQMGVEVDWRRVNDTMVNAYLLADLPQGLKELARRLCGVKMESYDDVCYAYSRAVVIDWFTEVAATLYDTLFETRYKRGRRKLDPARPVLEKRAAAPEEAVRTLRKVEKVLREEGCDPWRRWEGWYDHDRALIQDLMGEAAPPAKSLFHVPRRRAVSYSALDAVATFRVSEALRRRSKRVLGRVL
jgi:uracil-DNA glycosylase family 4